MANKINEYSEWRRRVVVCLSTQELEQVIELHKRFRISGGISGTIRHAITHLYMCSKPSALTASIVSLDSTPKPKLEETLAKVYDTPPAEIILPKKTQVSTSITDILKLADGINENSELSTEDDDVGLDEIKLSKLNLPASSEAANGVPNGEPDAPENISANADQPIDKRSP